MKPVSFFRNAWRRKERKTESRRDGSSTAEGPYPSFSTQSESPVATLAMNSPILQKDLSASIEEAWPRQSAHGAHAFEKDDLENKGYRDHPIDHKPPLNARNDGHGPPFTVNRGPQRNVACGPPRTRTNSAPPSPIGQNSRGCSTGNYPTLDRQTNSSSPSQRADSSIVPTRSATFVAFAVPSAAPRSSSSRSALSPARRKGGDLERVHGSREAVTRTPRFELQGEPFSAPPFISPFRLVNDDRCCRPTANATTPLKEASARTVDAILDLSSFSRPRSLYAATGSMPYLPFVKACSLDPELHLADGATSHADLDSCPFPLALFPTPPPLIVRRKKRVPKPLILYPTSVPHRTYIPISSSPEYSSSDSTPPATSVSPQSLPRLSPSSSSPILLRKGSSASILPPRYAPPDKPLPMPPVPPKSELAATDTSRALRVARSYNILRQPTSPLPHSHRVSSSEPISELYHNKLSLARSTGSASRTYSESGERKRPTSDAQVQWGYAL